MTGSLPDITLFIATSNAGKLRDFAAAPSAGFILKPLPGIERIPAPVEDAESFAGNALLKAIAYSSHLVDQIVLADDSGLEVDALGGAPGVYSARYAVRAGFNNTAALSPAALSPAVPSPAVPFPAVPFHDALNNAYLIHQLKGIRRERRTARYRCVLAAARNGAPLRTADSAILGDGTVEGIILNEPQGSGGFGYDPLFFLPERGQSMAEVPLEEKIKFSHRGRALADLLRHLR